MTIIGTAGPDRGRQLVHDQGAHHALDHKVPNQPDEVMRLTDGRGVKVMLEMLANVNVAKDLALHAKRRAAITSYSDCSCDRAQ